MLSRTPSGTLRSLTNIENVTAALNQKDKMIELLKRELEGFRNLRQEYDRLRDRKLALLDKCDSVNRQITLSKDSQKRKANSDLDMVQDISSTVLTLEKDLQNKTYQLKTLKCQTQTMLASSDQRESDLNECFDTIEATKAAGESLKMERDRLRLQLNQIEEDISKVKHSCNQSIGSFDKVRNQIHNTQSLMRNLQNEEANAENKLSSFSDENNALDGIIDDLNNLIEMTRMKIKDMKQQKENIELNIKAKQLQKGRIETEYSEKHKQFKNQREKEKIIKDELQGKKAEVKKLSNMCKEVCEETEDIISRNLSVEEINSQLKNDLEVCRRHLENVSRANSTVSEELEAYKKTNKTVIKKLERPLDECWSELHHVQGKNQLVESTSDNFMAFRM